MVGGLLIRSPGGFCPGLGRAQLLEGGHGHGPLDVHLVNVSTSGGLLALAKALVLV